MKKVCTTCFKSLGVDSRFKIYQFVDEGKDKNVTQITNFTGLRQPTVSYHLKEMVESGLLKRNVIGKEVHYSVNKNCPHDGKICIVHKD